MPIEVHDEYVAAWSGWKEGWRTGLAYLGGPSRRAGTRAGQGKAGCRPCEAATGATFQVPFQVGWIGGVGWGGTSKACCSAVQCSAQQCLTRRGAVPGSRSADGGACIGGHCDAPLGRHPLREVDGKSTGKSAGKTGLGHRRPSRAAAPRTWAARRHLPPPGATPPIKCRCRHPSMNVPGPFLSFDITPCQAASPISILPHIHPSP